MIERATIVALARGELATRYPGLRRTGTRWQHQARTLGLAVDCVGLVGAVALAAGVAEARAWFEDDDLKRYGRPPDPSVLLGAARRYMDEIAVADALPADVLVMASDRSPTVPTHFALVTQADPRYIIHAHAAARRVIEHRHDEGARWPVLRAFRFRGVA